MKSMEGKHFSSVMQDWGPPEQTFSDGKGGQVLIWRKRREWTMPGGSTTTTTASGQVYGGNRQPATYGGTATSHTVYTPAQRQGWTAWRMFWVDATASSTAGLGRDSRSCAKKTPPGHQPHGVQTRSKELSIIGEPLERAPEAAKFRGAHPLGGYFIHPEPIAFFGSRAARKWDPRGPVAGSHTGSQWGGTAWTGKDTATRAGCRTPLNLDVAALSTTQ